MDFALSKEQELFRSSIRKFLNSVEQTKVARSYIEGDDRLFKESWNGLAALGTMGIMISEDYGGLGFNQIDLVPAIEELGRILYPGIFVETIGFAAPLIERYGTEQQKDKYLPEIASGTRTMSLAWLEPNTMGYEQNDIQTTAIKSGHSLTIKGVKTLVPEGKTADTLIVPVKTDGDKVSLVLINQRDYQLNTSNLQCVDGTRNLAEINLNHVQVSLEQVLGPMNEGWNILQEGLLHLNAALAASLVGGLDRVVEMAVDYANTREQFGHPIGRYQSIKHRIVDMKVDLETARSLTYYANWAIDQDVDDKLAAVAGARAFATEVFLKAAGHNVQIHGGIGYTSEVDCHLYLKRAISMESYLGSIEDYYEQVALGKKWLTNELQLHG